MAPVRLTKKWWLVRDTGCPIDYPPRARDELVTRRLEMLDRHEWRESDSASEDVWHHRYDGQTDAD